MNENKLELLSVVLLRLRVDKTFPLEDAGEALRYIEERKNIDKVVLVSGV